MGGQGVYDVQKQLLTQQPQCGQLRDLHRRPELDEEARPHEDQGGQPAGEGWDLEHWGQSLTLVNWCTMMCKQCRFMSSACVLSAASRICNGRNHEALPRLTHR